MAVFLSMTTAAQLPGQPAFNKIPAYQPLKFETLKKFRSPEPSYDVSGIKRLHSFEINQPEMSSFNARPLQQYLAKEGSYYRMQQNKNVWMKYANTSSNSVYKQEWYENKNNVQQRWMAKKIKGQ